MADSEIPPHAQALLDQADAVRRTLATDLPLARAEGRCLRPPQGCGQGLRPSVATHFRDQRSRDEYGISGLCQTCQDVLFKSSYTSEEIKHFRERPETYQRCEVCGEWRELEFVDVGIGVISGHDCCASIRFGTEPLPPACSRTPNCRFGADHAHECEVWETTREKREGNG